MTGSVLFFRHDGGVDEKHLAAVRAATPDHTARLWRPGHGLAGPGGVAGGTYAFYGVWHHLRLFANRDYSALEIISRDGKIDHVSCIFPGFFRFPFMQPDDLQIGLTETSSDMRGRGLATRAILEIVEIFARPGRRFWYLTGADNSSSVRTIEKAGFAFVGEGAKEPRLGLTALGAYRLREKAA